MSAPQSAQPFDLESFAIHHVMNSQEWHVPFVGPIHVSSLTLHGLMIIFVAVFLLFLFCVLYRRQDKVPTGITNFLESFVVFVRDDIARPNLGHEDAQKLTPLLCTFFFFILGMNLLGMIPLFSAATANINVTAALAFITLCFMVFGAIYRKGVVGFFKSFVPHDVPVFILPMLVPLEFLGVFIRAFALMIRLFANMLGGHVVIFSLLGLVGLFGLVALPSVILVLFVSLIELLVAFLQAYIFTLLSAIFIGQSLAEHH